MLCSLSLCLTSPLNRFTRLLFRSPGKRISRMCSVFASNSIIQHRMEKNARRRVADVVVNVVTRIFQGREPMRANLCVHAVKPSFSKDPTQKPLRGNPRASRPINTSPSRVPRPQRTSQPVYIPRLVVRETRFEYQFGIHWNWLKHISY